MLYWHQYPKREKEGETIMVRTAKSKIGKKDKHDRLYKAILMLETEEECYNFFQDLCTEMCIRDRRGLAGTGGADDGHHLALVDIQIAAVQCVNGAVVVFLDQVLYGEAVYKRQQTTRPAINRLDDNLPRLPSVSPPTPCLLYTSRCV